MHYPGEHLLPGQLGYFFVVLSLVASMVATFSYFKATTSKIHEDAAYWKKLARWSFITESVSVFAIFGLLIYLLTQHLFEYKYAWQHSSKTLEFKYIFASIWEGQEGSFLLWSFWHCILGLILIKTSKQWEAPVMTVVSFAQFCLGTMIIGIYIFNQKLGSNPFILLRESGIFDNAPGMHVDFNLANPIRPDYLSLSQMKDGNDLNILLQNYWMVIHPPVLFLGFASTLIPFAFVVAGLWLKKTAESMKLVLPWALFASAALGVGIMMGAAWAYESLNFGGYWAWDPVENASLVPWLVLIAGIHTLLIYKHRGHSLKATLSFFIAAFWLILYSTFLTRSGILGDTSVHAFTDLGMNLQLYLFMYLVVWLPGLLVAKNKNQRNIGAIIAIGLLPILYLLNFSWLGMLALIAGVVYTIYQATSAVPSIKSEENTSSREFWMFIGSLMFFLSAIIIIIQTSLPVINKVFGKDVAPPEDAEFAYNSIQIFVAIIVAVLSAITQYLKYKDTNSLFFWKRILIPTLISLVIATIFVAFGQINYVKKGPVFKASIWLALICSIYAIIANASYIWIGLKGKLKLAGGSVAHLGFGTVLLGILISSSNKETLSNNVNGIPVPLANTENPAENLTLVQGLRTDMGKYWVTFEKDSSLTKKPKTFFKLNFNAKNGKENFTLQPNAFVNYKMEGLQANPDAKHFWDHDVFVYITSIPDPDRKPDTSSFRSQWMKAGDTAFYSGGFMVLERFVTEDSVPNANFKPGDLATAGTFKVFSKNGTSYTSTPLLLNRGGQSESYSDTVLSENLVLKINKAEGNRIEAGIKDTDFLMKYVTIKAYKFPFISLLWLGVIITVVGIIISMARRIALNRKDAA
ncbi:MAG TPA: cytochrome c biogenesis protein CcsA [Chitinophagaceae bacterium]|nr:cytochrome c biogenesis protein CcsA [Chitinophagaceae bacterium]